MIDKLPEARTLPASENFVKNVPSHSPVIRLVTI